MARFVKGQSGNPGGKSKLDVEFNAAVKKAGAKALLKILEIAERDGDENQYKACQWLAERGYGKPSQHVEVTGENGGPLVAVIRDA